MSWATLGAFPSEDTSPSTSIPTLAPSSTEGETVFELVIGSGDVVRSIAMCGRARSDSGGRTPPRRNRGVVRGLRRSACGGGGRESSVLLGNQERKVRWDRPSACVVAVPGAGLDRALGVATGPVPNPEPVPVLGLGLALSGTGLQGNSGRRDGKNRRGGTFVVFGERRDEVVVGAVVSSGSGSTMTMLLPSRPDERRRDVKSVKSTVRGRAGSRLMDGWRVSGGADGTAVGDGGPHPSGDVSRRRTQSSRRLAERSM
jgi:hypothetical protein